MSDFALPVGTLAVMRDRARTHVALDTRAVAGGFVDSRVDKIVFAAIQDANPGASFSEVSDLMGLGGDEAIEVRETERLKSWWPTDLVAQLAGMAAPRRARLAILFRHGKADAPALYGRRAQCQMDMFDARARA